jgi:hypothetical protein
MSASLLRPVPTRERGGRPAAFRDAPVLPSERKRLRAETRSETSDDDDEQEPRDNPRADDALLAVLRSKQHFLTRVTEFLDWAVRDAPAALATEMYAVLYRTETRGDQFRMHSPKFVWVPMALDVTRDEYGMAFMAVMTPPADALVSLPVPADRHRQLIEGESMVATVVCGGGADNDESFVLFYGQMPAPREQEHERAALVSETHFCCPTSDGAVVVMRPVGRTAAMHDTRVAFAVHEVHLGMHLLFTSNRPPRWPMILAYAYLKRFPRGDGADMARAIVQTYKRIRSQVAALDATHLTLDTMDFDRRRFASPFQEARVTASPERGHGRARAQPESELSRPSEVARASCIVS